MTILLDESVPAQILPALIGHQVQTVRQAGWTSVTNGELLRLAEGRFDAFLTGDKNLKYQQNLRGRQISIVELSTIRKTINLLKAGDFVQLNLQAS